MHKRLKRIPTTFPAFALGALLLTNLVSFGSVRAAAGDQQKSRAPAVRVVVQAQVAQNGAQTEQAGSADGFVETVGFNAHFENHYTPYVTRFSEVKQLLTDADVRHVRVGMLFRNPTFDSMMQELAAAGIHGLYVTQPKFTQAQIEQFPASVAPSLELYEAPNEPDNMNDPDWAAKCRAFQQNLYSWVKNDPQTSRYPVVGPSIIKKWGELGDISQYIDYANIHNYLDVFNPGTNGFGGITPYGVYGSIRYNLNIVKVTSSSKPVISTETGYGATATGGMTATNRPILDYRAQMRYIPRLFFEQYRNGIVRTYSYEFIDKGGNGTFDNFGVLKMDLTPKPAYTALKSILRALNDPGPAFTPQPLSLQFTGNTSNVHTVLLQRHNGDYVLAIWLEVPSWHPHGGGDIIVPDQQVGLRVESPIGHASLSTLDENGNISTRSLALSSNSIALPVCDKISLVTFGR